MLWTLKGVFTHIKFIQNWIHNVVGIAACLSKGVNVDISVTAFALASQASTLFFTLFLFLLPWHLSHQHASCQFYTGSKSRRQQSSLNHVCLLAAEPNISYVSTGWSQVFDRCVDGGPFQQSFIKCSKTDMLSMVQLCLSQLEQFLQMEQYAYQWVNIQLLCPFTAMVICLVICRVRLVQLVIFKMGPLCPSIPYTPTITGLMPAPCP